MGAKLGVNVDHVATLRQARMVDYPDPLEAALLAEKAGACQITVHLREDRRHIQDHDVKRIKKSIKTRLNLEMAIASEIVEFALKVKPWQVTLVPEKRAELTTEGGLDVIKSSRKLKSVIEKFHSKKIFVALFIDPDIDQVEACLKLGADAVEFNTGSYAEATNKRDSKRELIKVQKAVKHCAENRIVAHAGHGLTLDNVGPVASIANVAELNIGHAIVSRAVMVGFENAVHEMIEAMEAD